MERQLHEASGSEQNSAATSVLDSLKKIQENEPPIAGERMETGPKIVGLSPENAGFAGLPSEKNGEPVVRLVNMMVASPTANIVNEDTSGSSMVMNSYPSHPPVVEDIEEEAQNERERRRSSMREQEKLAFMAKFKNSKNSEKVAHKLLSMLGNIDPQEPNSTSHSRAGDKKVSFLTKEIADNLRWYREYSKNYTEVYLTKTKLLYIIVLKVLSQYQQKVKETQDYFKRMSDSMMKYWEGKALTIEIVEKMGELNQLIKSFDLQRRSIDEEFNDLDQLFATLGEAQPNMTTRINNSTTFSGPNASKHRESVIHAQVETEESRKFHLDPNCPEMIKQIVQSAECFQDSFARLFRKLSKSKTSTGLFDLFEDFADPVKNPFVLEHNMALNFQSCSFVMFTCILPKVFDLHRQVTDTILQGKSILEILYKRDPHLLSETVVFPLSSTLQTHFKRYIKAKLGLEDKKILKDEDLREFLVQKHLLSYPQISQLWKAGLLCAYKTKTKKVLQVLLAIDVGCSAHSVPGHYDCTCAAYRVCRICLSQESRSGRLDPQQHSLRRCMPSHPDPY